MSVTKAEVDAAIRRVLFAGQSYTMSDGWTVTNANLGELREMRRELEAEESSEAEGGVYMRTELGRPS